jgi:transposase InsO family protein
MERRKRRRFTPEYKAEVVRLIRTSGKNIGQATKDLDLTETAVRAWVRQAGIDEKRDPRGPLTSEERAAGAAEARAQDGHDGTGIPPKSWFLFLVVILDLSSRKVVGWSLGDRLDAELSGEALKRALARRAPRSGLVFHSDRGSEFAAASFRRILLNAGALQSMSRKGDCWDNAVAESFFSTLEFEGPSATSCRMVGDAEHELFSFIESYYNASRLHSHNDYRSPNETEADWRGRKVAA